MFQNLMLSHFHYSREWFLEDYFKKKQVEFSQLSDKLNMNLPRLGQVEPLTKRFVPPYFLFMPLNPQKNLFIQLLHFFFFLNDQ